MLSFPHPQIRSVLALEGLIAGREIPKHPALEQSLPLDLGTKLVTLDVHLCEAEGDEKILCKGRVE